MAWLKALLIVAVICAVLFFGNKAYAKARFEDLEIEPPPPPPAPPWTLNPGASKVTWYSGRDQLIARYGSKAESVDYWLYNHQPAIPAATESDPVIVVDPGNSIIGMYVHGMTATEMIARYGIDKTKGMIGYLAKRRSQPLALPIMMTQEEVNQISTAWNGSIGYFETIKFASNVGVALLSLTPARPIALGYKAIDKALEPPPPPPIR